MSKKLEVIIVLGGWLTDQPDGRWRTMDFGELDGEGNESGDRVRVVAASFLYKKNRNLRIIVSGSKGRLNDIAGCPTLASVLKRELIDLGVNPDNIIEEQESTGTYRQLKNSFQIIQKLKLLRVGIISNEYHLQRVGALLEVIPSINWPDLELISAEKVATENHPEFWEAEIRTAYESEAMQRRIALEQKGVRDIKEGRYNFS